LAAAHLQRILPDVVLVGGSASAVYAAPPLSTDADHILTDLRPRFDMSRNVVYSVDASVQGIVSVRAGCENSDLRGLGRNFA